MSSATIARAWLGVALYLVASAALAVPPTVPTAVPATMPATALAPERMPPSSRPPPAIPIDLDHARLKPGQFIWLPEIAPAGPLVIIVSIPEQQAYVYRNGVRIAVSTVSTGKKGHDTPTGVFTILQKHKVHKSTLYDDAPMPFMQRLTWNGVALHAGKLPGYPASHGCVRMPMEFAKRLFQLTTYGITVIIANDSSMPADIAHPGVFVPPLPTTAAPGAAASAREPRLSWFEDYRWRPDISPAGPLTIILSGADKRVLVMRNGVEIGRARFALRDSAPLGTRAYVLLQGQRSEPSALVPSRPALNWMQINLPGYAGTPGQSIALDAQAARRVILPAQFASAVYDAIAPGTTLLVTDAAVLPRTTGPAMTVLSAGVPADEEAPPLENP